MANLFLCHDDEGNEFFLDEEEYFEHSKGPWKEHKYLYIDGDGNYIYDGDTSAMSIKRFAPGRTKVPTYIANTVVDTSKNKTFARSYKNAADKYSYAVYKGHPQRVDENEDEDEDRIKPVYDKHFYDLDSNEISSTQVNMSALKNITKDFVKSSVYLIKSSSAYANGKTFLSGLVKTVQHVKRISSMTEKIKSINKGLSYIPVSKKAVDEDVSSYMDRKQGINHRTFK